MLASMSSSFRRASRWVVPLSMVLASGCGGALSGSASSDPVTAENMAVDSRLQGAWKIGDFTPDPPLGPALDQMLAFHKQVMVIYFQNSRIRADSPGITFDRRYEVKNAQGDRFQIIAYDETGTPQLSFCNFMPDGSVRVAMTSPWHGVGSLIRAR